MRIQLSTWNCSVEIAGSGQPLLFLHGYPLSKKIWQPQTEELAAYAQVITPDLPGHGESDALPEKYSIDRLAEECMMLLTTLAIKKPPVVCGLSMGGYVALAIYRKYPDKIAGLILAATRAAADSQEAKANRDKAILAVQAHGAQAIADNMIPKMFAPNTYRDQSDLVESLRNLMASTPVAGIIGALVAMRDRPDSTPSLSGITKPVLIVHGNEDQLIPIREAQAMQALIPGSELITIPNAGHILNLEQPEQFNYAVITFLKRI